MGIEIRYVFKKELFPELREILALFQKYVYEHPIPDVHDAVMEVMAIDKQNDTTWSWEWKRTKEQTNWQGAFETWLRNHLCDFSSKGVKGIGIKIMHEDKNDEQEISKSSALIKGEGLASFQAIVPKFTIDKLVVTDELSEKISNTISIIKNIDLIYNVWGFSEVDSQPRAILNFFGPPGTGKTMAAHCIADALGKKILIANFAEIESKYVGDSPKNLENIFTVAKNEDAVLFFDEADSFLGKRLTAISSSSDQAVNSLRSKLLQLLEDHSGIVIFCTNLLKNYDKAFESRILRSLKFELPDDACRKRLIRQMIPAKVPFSNEQALDETALQLLSEAADGFSGREIKNAVLQVLCKAASEGKHEFLISDFKTGFDVMRQEIASMKKERGELDPERKKKLENAIQENLRKGNFKIQKKRRRAAHR